MLGNNYDTCPEHNDGTVFGQIEGNNLRRGIFTLQRA